MVCVGGGRESFQRPSAAVWADHDAVAAAQFSLERARARILSDYKRAITAYER